MENGNNKSIPRFCFTEAYSEPCQTSKMQCFAKIVIAEKALTIFPKNSILDIWQGSEYASVLAFFFLTFLILYCLEQYISTSLKITSDSVYIIVMEHNVKNYKL